MASPAEVVLLLALAPVSWCQQFAVPEDLECQKGPHAAVWSNVKKSFRGLLEDTPGALCFALSLKSLCAL